MDDYLLIHGGGDEEAGVVLLGDEEAGVGLLGNEEAEGGSVR